MKNLEVYEAKRIAGSEADIRAIYGWVESAVGPSKPRVGFEAGEELPTSGIAVDPESGKIELFTWRGLFRLERGNWIVKQPDGKFMAYSEEVFEKEFEPFELGFIKRDR